MKCVVCGEEVKGTYEIVPGIYRVKNGEEELAKIHPMCTKE